MSEKTIYRLSEVFAHNRGRMAARLAVIHFIDLSDEDKRSELEAIRSLTNISPERKRSLLTLMGGIADLDSKNQQALASELREDYRNDLLAGLL